MKKPNFCSIHHITLNDCMKEAIITPKRHIQYEAETPSTIITDVWDQDSASYVYHRLAHNIIDGLDQFTVWTVEAVSDIRVGYQMFDSIAKLKKAAKALY